MKKLKVYGGQTFALGYQTRTVVAARNQQEVADIAHCSLYHVRGWWAETGNKEEIRLALKNPWTPVYP